MRSLCFNPKTPSFSNASSSPRRTTPASTPRRSFFYDTVMELVIEPAGALITKWDFQKEIKAHPEISQALLRVLSQRIRALEEQFWT